MKLSEYVKNTENFYEVHGIYTTPSADYLFNNFNKHIESWLSAYGDCEVLRIKKDISFYDTEFDYVIIDNKV